MPRFPLTFTDLNHLQPSPVCPYPGDNQPKLLTSSIGGKNLIARFMPQHLHHMSYLGTADFYFLYFGTQLRNVEILHN